MASRGLKFKLYMGCASPLVAVVPIVCKESVAFVLFCGICTHAVNVMSCCVPLPYPAM